MGGRSSHSKPELSTLLERGTFYFALTDSSRIIGSYWRLGAKHGVTGSWAISRNIGSFPAGLSAYAAVFSEYFANCQAERFHLGLAPLVAENQRHLRYIRLPRRFQPQVAIDHFAGAAGKDGNLETELANAAAHSINRGVVL
jgi:hypothetical protein